MCGKLAGRPQRVVVVTGIVLGNRRPRLHRVADQAVVDEADPGDVRRAGKGLGGGGGVAAFPVEAGVVRDVVEDGGGVRADRIEHADDRRQHVVVDLHRFCRRPRLLQRLGDDEGDGIADAADLADRQRRVGRLLHRRAVDVGDPPAAGDAADTVRLEIGPGEYPQHAGHRRRRGGVDGPEDRVRMLRAHEHPMGHVGPLDVGNVVALAGEEALVLLAQDRSADARVFRHDYSPAPACIALVPASTAATMFW